MSYDLQELKDIPIRDLATSLGIIFKGNPSTSNARCFNQQAHPKGDAKPSMGFNNKTNRFKCFACEATGSTIDLVMQTQGLDLKEACEWLANKYGIDPNKNGYKRIEYKDTNKIVENRYSDPTTADIESYKQFYKLCDPLDDKGRQLLQGKGFTPETIKQFGWRTITSQAVEKAKADKNLETSGLKGLLKVGWCLIPFYQDTDIFYLRARNPVSKEFSNPIGKTTQFYNYNALYAITGANKLYVCEGETDTMTLAQENLPAVGILGATQDQTVRRLVEFIASEFGKDLKVVLCFDNDQQGRLATDKTAKEFLSIGIRAEIKEIPDNYKDINDYYNNKETNAKEQS